MVEAVRELIRKTLPTDEELIREAINKIRRKEYGQLTDWEHAAVMYALERAVVEHTMKRYALPLT
jgi:hypothetical protein